MSDTDSPLIHKKLLTRIEEKMGRLNSLRPLPADAKIRLHDEKRLLHTYHSNAIEGNTPTLSETRLVLEEGTTIGGKSLREHLEATNNAKAFDMISYTHLRAHETKANLVCRLLLEKKKKKKHKNAKNKKTQKKKNKEKKQTKKT